jgi:hypothetical protein
MARSVQLPTVKAAGGRANRFGRRACGRIDEVRAGITDDLKTVARADMQYSSWMVELFALIDERDAAFEFLRNAINRGFLNYPFLAQHNRLLKGLHSDPRFAPLMEDLRTRWTTVHRSSS